MLVLTRKPHESIMIGDDIEVRVLSVVGDKVRTRHPGAARDPVYRKEIYLEIAQQNAARAAIAAGRSRRGTQAPRRQVLGRVAAPDRTRRGRSHRRKPACEPTPGLCDSPLMGVAPVTRSIAVS